MGGDIRVMSPFDFTKRIGICDFRSLVPIASFSS